MILESNSDLSDEQVNDIVEGDDNNDNSFSLRKERNN